MLVDFRANGTKNDYILVYSVDTKTSKDLNLGNSTIVSMDFDQNGLLYYITNGSVLTFNISSQ